MPISKKKADDYELLLSEARRCMEIGLNFSSSEIPSYILQSWRRSRSHGILKTDNKLTPTGQDFMLDEGDRNLASVVGDEIESIWESFGGDNWVVYCTNAQALIIKAKHGANSASKSYAIEVGRRIQEVDIGTTAPSLALREKQSITLTASEHYLDEFQDMFCCAAPVWGPWGKIIGTLNITGSEDFRSRLVEKKIATAAMKIENRLFLEAHDNSDILRIHFDVDFITSHLAGLIAVNEYGDILSATQNALEMLEDIDPILKRYSINDIFHSEIVATGSYLLKSTMRNGVFFYIQSQQNKQDADLVEKYGVRSGGSVRELSDLHIMETIRKCGGNISKAAEILGLSRTTLYRVQQRQKPPVC